MKELQTWELSHRELRLIKTALLNLPKATTWGEEALELAEQIPVDPLQLTETKQRFSIAQILQAVKDLEGATVAQVEEKLGAEKPNSIGSLLSKLYQEGQLDREKLKAKRNGRGVASSYLYKPKGVKNA